MSILKSGRLRPPLLAALVVLAAAAAALYLGYPSMASSKPGIRGSAPSSDWQNSVIFLGVPDLLDIDSQKKISEDVLASTTGTESASVVIFLAEQADVSSANDMTDHDLRGWYVYETLIAHANRTQADLRTLLNSEGVPYQAFWVANMLVLDADRSMIERLAARHDVARIDSNKPTRWIEDPAIADERPAPKDAAAPDAIEWGVNNVNAPAVWAMGFTGQGIVLGGLDTGIRWSHNSIKSKYRGWNGATADHNYNWFDAIHSGGGVCGPNTAAPCDDNGHGTHTVGSMVGDDGGANQIGVAPGAKWMGCRNMNVGDGTPATYAECFQFTIAPTDLAGNNPNPTLRPHILNNSWGCPASEGCTTRAELETIVNNTSAAGIFVAVSAGNSGPGCSTVSDPAAIYNASFSVGAYSSTNTLASFSSRGPSTYYSPALLKPNISAPGVSVRSATRSSDTAYSSLSGTSMAGPHVAGVISLLWSARPHLARNIAATKTLLQNTANPAVTVSAQTCGGTPSTQIPNNSFGYGRVDALAAVNAAGTPTPTPTPASIAGNVSYAIVSKPVPAVLMSAAGSPGTSGMTDAMGNYLLNSFGAGAYIVTPSKPTQQCGTLNGVFSLDASKVAQHVVGLRPFNASEQQAAMVAGVGFISSFDASLIARRVVGLCTDPTNLGGSWLFTPANRMYPSVTTAMTGENYTAILMGDVDGDWNPAGPNRPAVPAAGDRNAVSASLPKVAAQTGSVVEVPLSLARLKGTGINAYQFDIEYDPAVIEPAEVAADLDGTLSSNLSAIHNVAEPGLLKVAIYGAYPASGDGVYAHLRFNVIGKPGTTSPINIREFRFNEGTAGAVSLDGQIMAAKPDTVLQGRLVTATGEPVARTTVVLTNTTGEKREVKSTSFGYFEFGGLEMGQTYTVTARSRRHTFAPITVSVVASVTTLDMTAGQ